MLGEGGAGLGYHGLNGMLALEFDFSIDWVWNDPGESFAHLSILKANPWGILESNHIYEVISNKKPVNIANTLKPGYVINPEVLVTIVKHD